MVLLVLDGCSNSSQASILFLRSSRKLFSSSVYVTFSVCKAVFASLRDAKNDVCFLQETHSTKEREKIWASEWGGQIFFANGSSGSRGVAILFSRSLSPDVHLIHRDPEGRFILMHAYFDGWPATLINIYAPTADQPENQIRLLGNLEELLHNLDSVNLILGGDLNCCLDPFSDRYDQGADSESVACSPPSPSRARLTLKVFIEEFSLYDAWRLMHPHAKQFTFRRAAYASRLDYWFVSEHLTEWIRKSEIRPTAQSDHSAVFLALQAVPITRGPGIWRFDNSLLLDKTFVSEMSNFLKDLKPDNEISSPHVQWDFVKHKIKTFCMAFERRARSRLKSKLVNLIKDLQSLEEDNPSTSLDKNEVYRSKKKGTR